MSSILKSLSKIPNERAVLSVRDIGKTFVDGNGQPLAILTGGGFTEDEADSFLNLTPKGEIIAVKGEQDESSYFRNTAYAYILLLLLYITILMYGQFIVTSVVTEKSTKTMELLITSVKPAYLLFGKVAGVAAAGLTQLAAFIACGAASFAVNGFIIAGAYAETISEISISSELVSLISAPVSPLIFIYFAVYFLLGFLLYAFLYAALASTVSRMEDANSMLTFPILLVVAALFVSMIGLTDSNGALVRALSYFPFFTPMTMFMRVCMGSAGNGEAVISIFTLIISIFVLGYLSAKIYRAGVLMYGKPPKAKDLVKMLVKAKVF